MTGAAPLPVAAPNATATAAVGRPFLLAGQAIFTVSNAAGRHYTYRISRSKPRAGDDRAPAYFVSVLTGSDNTSCYSYLGLLDVATGAIRPTAKSAIAPTAESARVIAWTLGLVWAARALPAGYAVRHAGRCGRCARLLTDPESIDRGIGPDCWEKL